MVVSCGMKFAIIFLIAVLQADTISLISRLKKALFQLNSFIVFDKTDISFLKIPDLNLNVFNIRQSKVGGRLLLAKNDRDKRFVKSCRQILLLNVVTKILSKSLAKKLKHALPEIISSNQTTYGKNRCISKSLVIVIY